MSAPRVFYYAYCHQRPTGGHKHIYLHVDALNRHGVEAYVLHEQPDFRLTWFRNETPVVDEGHFRRVFDPERDFLVLPEDLGEKILAFPGRKVVFNQGLYNAFKYLPMNLRTYPYHSPDVLAVMVVSDHNLAHMQYAYPHLEVIKVATAAIDPAVFPFTPLGRKQRQIALVPKNLDHAMVLYHLLRSRGRAGLSPAENFRWIVLKGIPEAMMGRILSDSLLLVFLSVDEGLPTIPIEAMACGCLVVGYGQGPLVEELPTAYQFTHSQLAEAAEFIEQVMRDYPDRLGRFDDPVRQGRAIAAEHTRDYVEQSVVAAWDRIFKKVACPVVAP